MTHLTSTNCFFGIIPVSLSRKTKQSNTQIICLSPLMLENSLPLLGNTSAGANVLSQGVSRGFLSVPLHHINSKSDFASGQAVVGGTTYTFCWGYVLLFGIDLFGDKAIMDPIISEEPSYEENELKKHSDFSCV